MSVSVAERIINGDLDDEFDEISKAMSSRRKIIRQMTTAKNMMNIKVSDVVVLKGLTPKELNGRKGKVVDKNRSTIQVRFNDGRSTRKFGPTSLVTVPAVCVEKV